MIREQVKSLWKLCFDDSEAFIELYFRLRYNNEVNLAIQSGEEVIAALQMLPYPMTFCGQTVPTSYISGACTHPDYRSKGVMRELLSQSFARMLRNGVLFSTLGPGEKRACSVIMQKQVMPRFSASLTNPSLFQNYLPIRKRAALRKLQNTKKMFINI